MGKIRSTNQKVTATVHTVDPVIDGLLTNWGRWTQARGAGAYSESIWRLGGPGPRARLEVGVPTAPVDNAVAVLVERTVCNRDFSPRMRDILKAHYVVRGHPVRTCNLLGLHQASYDEWVWRAALFFANRYRAEHGVCGLSV